MIGYKLLHVLYTTLLQLIVVTMATNYYISYLGLEGPEPGKSPSKSGKERGLLCPRGRLPRDPTTPLCDPPPMETRLLATGCSGTVSIGRDPLLTGGDDISPAIPPQTVDFRILAAERPG